MAQRVRRAVRTFFQGDGLAPELREMLNRELLPVVRDLREAHNLSVGPVSATVTADTILDEESQYWIVDASAGVVTLTLPSASEWKLPIHIKRINAGSNVVISPDGSDTIDGASSRSLTSQYESVTLVSDENATWWEF